MMEWLRALIGWIRVHEELTAILLAFSVVTFFGSLAMVSVVIVRMPADYFTHRGPPPDSWRAHHPAIRLIMLALKNFFGIVLIAIGIVLVFPGVPGQGLLTILIGLGLLNFPGKRRLELKIVRSGPILKSINWIRAKRKRPALELPSK